MAAEPKKLLVKVNQNETVTSLIYPSARNNRTGITVVLAHGAGANQLSGFMQLFARGLSSRGLDACTFNFLYTEQGRRSPDPKPRLESCYQAVLMALREQPNLKKNKMVIGGKSMGGRIASQVAASWKQSVASKPLVSDLLGLIFYGYPLHPPGRPEQLRDKHLPDVTAPMLFVQGTRDPFASPDELGEVIKRLRLNATLHLVEGGDHSFKVPKSSGLIQEQVFESIMDETASWLTKKQETD